FFLARNILGKLLERAFDAGHPVATDEAHRTAADVLVDLLQRVGRCDPLRHHEAARPAEFPEREQYLGEGLLQGPAERAVGDGNKLDLDRLDHLADWVACGCWILSNDSVGELTGNQTFWHLDIFPTLET